MADTLPAASENSTHRPRIGLALAGGGPVGGVYELGTLQALDEAFGGIDLTNLDVYVGVSSGGFLAASLANQISPAKLCQIFIDNDDPNYNFSPEVFLKPALVEYFNRASSIPKLFLDVVRRFVRNPCELSESLSSLGSLIPTGIFDNETINKALTNMYTSQHRTNDFRKLGRKLYIVATELDTGRAVHFGTPGHDHVPISRAVQASAALPGLFPPVDIDGHYYVDGALLKTLNASIALDQGVDLAICINPLVPYDADLALKQGIPRQNNLAQGGLPVVLSQTLRSMMCSRMQVGMSKYDLLYENADVLLFEPNRDDAEMFFTNVFSYSSRHHLCEHAYQFTRKELLARREQLEPILARHGITLRLDILRDRTRHVTPQIAKEHAVEQNGMKKTAVSLTDSLDELQDWIKARKVSKVNH